MTATPLEPGQRFPLKARSHSMKTPVRPTDHGQSLTSTKSQSSMGRGENCEAYRKSLHDPRPLIFGGTTFVQQLHVGLAIDTVVWSFLGLQEVLYLKSYDGALGHPTVVRQTPATSLAPTDPFSPDHFDELFRGVDLIGMWMRTSPVANGGIWNGCSSSLIPSGLSRPGELGCRHPREPAPHDGIKVALKRHFCLHITLFAASAPPPPPYMHGMTINPPFIY